MTPRASRRLYFSLGAIFALFALVLLGILALSPAGRELMPQAGFFGAIALLVGYIVYAKGRTTALLKEEADASREEAERAFEQLCAGPALTTGVSLRWRARTYVVAVVVLLGAAAVAALGWSEGSWVVLGASGLVFAWVAKALLARLAEPEMLLVSPQGIEDRRRYGLISWQDIESVFLHEYEIKGTKAAVLSITVREPEAYMQRLAPLARFLLRAERLGLSQDIRLPLQGLDMAPLAVFRLIRAFHERTLPAGAIEGNDNFYTVDVEAARLKQLMADFEKTRAVPGSASGAKTRRQEELLARMEGLTKADRDRALQTRARARKTQWTAVAVAIALVIAVLLAAAAA
ncbi:MAG TPA: hypothetical protein VFZ74_02115 [Burkholderiales bacterium]